jgi:hypothetical protein
VAKRSDLIEGRTPTRLWRVGRDGEGLPFIRRRRGRISGESRSAGRGVEQAEGAFTHDRPDGSRDTVCSSGPTPSEVRRQIEQFFGEGADVAQRGPCPLCGQPMWARFAEVARCIWCESE